MAVNFTSTQALFYIRSDAIENILTYSNLKVIKSENFLQVKNEYGHMRI